MQNEPSYHGAMFCKSRMDKRHFTLSHIYYIKTMDTIFDQLYCDITEGYVFKKKNPNILTCSCRFLQPTICSDRNFTCSNLFDVVGTVMSVAS